MCGGDIYASVFEYRVHDPRAGDLVMVTDKSDPDWWIGTFKGKTGQFPANCTIYTLFCVIFQM